MIFYLQTVIPSKYKTCLSVILEHMLFSFVICILATCFCMDLLCSLSQAVCDAYNSKGDLLCPFLQYVI